MEITANELKNNIFIKYDGQIWQVLKSEHNYQGRGAAFIGARLRSPTIMVCEQLVESEKWNTNLPSSLLRGEKKFGYGNVRLEVSHCYDPVSRASAILSLTVSIDTTGSKKVHGGSATVLCQLKLIGKKPLAVSQKY